MSASTEHPLHFPFARQHTFDPPKENAKLRKDDPVCQVELYDRTKAWMVMRHKDCCEVLQSSKLSADRRHDGYPEIHGGGHKAKEVKPTFVNLDDPEHNQQRSMLEDAFTPAAIEKLRPMIQDVVDKNLKKMIEKAQDSKSIDLMENFAIPVPTEIVFKILGVPDDEVEELAKDSEVRHSTSRNAAESSNERLQDRMKTLVEKRIEEPQSDLISKLVTEQYQKGNLSKEDIVNLAFLVLTAGNAALLNSIGLGVVTLLSYPEQLEEFKNHPEIAPQVINELLRFNTASALNSRRATKESINIRGQQISENIGVICSVQSADRDRLQVDEPDPETFDIRRKRDPKQLLGFGYGPHRCQGEALSRVELEVALTTLFQRLPNLKLARDPEEFSYSPAEQNIGIQELPVLLGS